MNRSSGNECKSETNAMHADFLKLEIRNAPPYRSSSSSCADLSEKLHIPFVFGISVPVLHLFIFLKFVESERT